MGNGWNQFVVEMGNFLDRCVMVDIKTHPIFIITVMVSFFKGRARLLLKTPKKVQKQQHIQFFLGK